MRAKTRGKLLRCNFMARPKVHHERRITTAIRMPEQLHRRLSDEAEQRYLSVNFMVVKAVEEFVERLVPIDKLQITNDQRRPS